MWNAVAEAVPSAYRCIDVVGLCVVLLDVPFDIVGIKQLFWTWHDTDPVIFDRHFNVPWTSYYFHASFAAGFTILFNGTRDLIGHKNDANDRMHADGSVHMSLALTLMVIGHTCSM